MLGTLASWCMSTVLASQTDCGQVECCSLHRAGSIFLALGQLVVDKGKPWRHHAEEIAVYGCFWFSGKAFQAVSGVIV